MAALSVDGTPMPALPNSADQINYDNTTSGLSATTVKGAVDELASEKQDKSDNSLQTTNKTIVGGINELKSGLTNLNNRSYYITIWVEFNYYNSGQLSGTYTVPTLPTGWSYRIVSVSNIFPNSELGVKLSGKYLHNISNKEIRAVGTSFESTDTIAILVLFEIYKV